MVGFMSDQFDRNDPNRSTDVPFGTAGVPSAESLPTETPVTPPAAVSPEQSAAPMPSPVPPQAACEAPQAAPSAYPPVPPQPQAAYVPPQPPVSPQPQAAHVPPQAPVPQPSYAPPQAPYGQQPPQPGYVPPQPPVYQQPPYAVAPGYYAAPVPPKKTNGFAVASLICGVVALPLFCCIWLPILLGVLAIVFGILARRQDEKMPGMAVAGIICGVIGLVLAILCLVGYYTGSFEWALNDYLNNYNDWMYEFDQYAALFR